MRADSSLPSGGRTTTGVAAMTASRDEALPACSASCRPPEREAPGRPPEPDLEPPFAPEDRRPPDDERAPPERVPPLPLLRPPPFRPLPPPLLRPPLLLRPPPPPFDGPVEVPPSADDRGGAEPPPPPVPDPWRFLFRLRLRFLFLELEPPDAAPVELAPPSPDGRASPGREPAPPVAPPGVAGPDRSEGSLMVPAV
jgi:hypothetical protein